MKTKSHISYGTRSDKSMKTWMQLSRLFYTASNKEVQYFSEHELTLNQFKVLEVLYHRGDLNIGAITKLTMSTPGNITVVIKNLKRDGWITSIQDPLDKRASILTITQKGQEKMKEVFPQHAKNLTENMDILSDEELDTLQSLLKKVYTSL